MHTIAEINLLLDDLDELPADDLEDQELDFKEWNNRSRKDAVNLVVEMAICMANGGGRTVVFGVKDNVVGRKKAIIGVPDEIDLNRLKKAVYDSTDPKLTPGFEELRVPEGAGRIIVMFVYPGLPPYTDTSGRGKIRTGKDCQPLTGTLRRRIMVETGKTDYTATKLSGSAESHISAAAMEHLRDCARKEQAPEDLLELSDIDLLSTLGLISGNRLTLAGLLLAGKKSSIKTFLSGYGWTHLRMKSDTQYSDRMDGQEALLVALERITDRIMADNPIATVEQGLFHFEYRSYPEVALREALMNAFCHSDYQIAAPLIIKQFPDKIEISNAGGFIGGISPDNILHHMPVARNPLLVEAMTRLRLINRSNLGIPRMFTAMLIEGKEPPLISDQGDSVSLIFMAGEMSVPFRMFVAEEGKKGRILSLDHLLIIQYLLGHSEIDTTIAARICQRRKTEIREILSRMESNFGYLERGGTGRGTYWMLHQEIYRKIGTAHISVWNRRIERETAKTRILSILKQKAKHGETGLSNTEIRKITRDSRDQVKRFMAELRDEGSVNTSGKGAGTIWVYTRKENGGK